MFSPRKEKHICNMSATITEVDKQLSLLLQELAQDEAEVRCLREDVLNLEVITAVQGEGAVAEVSHISREEKREMIRQEMPPKLLAELVSKRDLLRAARETYIKALESKHTAEVTMDASFADEDSKEDHLEKLYTRAKWRPGQKAAYVCPITVSDENTRLKKKLVELYQSRKVLEEQTERLSSAVKALVAEVEGNSGLEKERFTAETESRLKDFELREVQDEIKMYQRILQKKNRMLDSAPSPKSKQFKVKMIEDDKRAAVLKLTNQRTSALTAVSTIRYTAVLLRQLEERIEMIGEAVRGDVSNDPSDQSTPDGLTDVPRVDVQLLEEAGREVQRLTLEQASNLERLENVDGLIEVVERKIAVLEYATKRAQIKTEQTRTENEHFLALLDDEFRDHEDEVNEVVDQLKSEISQIKQKLAKSQSSP